MPLKGNVFSVIHTNTRYLLLVIPGLLLCAYMGIQSFGKTARTAILSVALALTILANFTSLDPVSKKVFGTISAGNTDLYCMTSLKSSPDSEQTYC